MTGREEAFQFFREGEVELLKNLSQAGIKLSEFKLIPAGDKLVMSDMGSSSNSGDSFRGEGRSEQGQHGQYQGQQRGQGDGSDRRRQLWEQARQQSQFAFA
jgi:hypothetical protein